MLSYIHFIRHGITEGIQNKWYYGATDMPLVDVGFEEIESFKNDNIYPPLGSSDCYTSGVLRANETFSAIYGNSPYRVLPSFREMNFGAWECKTFEELQYMDGYDTWINDKTGTFVYPGGDSAVSFYERVSGGLTELLSYHNLKEPSKGSSDDSMPQPPASIVVCHGGVIAVCMCLLMGIPKEDFWKWIPAPARGYTVFFEDGQPIKYEAI